ncbi:hypothetical protein ES332_A11G261400v1 [Gossypium tomentosum]|uniref:Uncharacterized protein n=1 Tax=Gossypium tomentosum TaxID=34277 RepID=A0A5D2NFG5_GOSTO|nr:hypothetical protein ES332_A11G261400v1 [Gossypium tomentosum]
MRIIERDDKDISFVFFICIICMRIVVAMGLKNEIVFLEWRVQWGLGRKCLGFVCFEGVYGLSFQVFSRQLIQWMGPR